MVCFGVFVCVFARAMVLLLFLLCESLNTDYGRLAFVFILPSHDIKGFSFIFVWAAHTPTRIKTWHLALVFILPSHHHKVSFLYPVLPLVLSLFLSASLSLVILSLSLSLLFAAAPGKKKETRQVLFVFLAPHDHSQARGRLLRAFF